MFLNSQPSTLNLVLTRTFTRGEYTHGSLSIDGTKICSTLENANSQVPAGDYVISLIKCKHHSRKMPVLNPNAPCDRCPRSLNPNPSSLNLSEHFTLKEFEKSATADKYRINNSVPPQYIPTLQQLCKEVLEPLRSFVGGPIVISSGYRCNQLNVKVGGAYASLHTLGEAADIKLPVMPYTSWTDNKQHTDVETAHKWIDWLERNVNFDQIILETSNGHDYWLHISCRKNLRANRHQVIRYLKK